MWFGEVIYFNQATQGADSIWIWYLNSLGIPTMEIRLSSGHPIARMGIPKLSLYWTIAKFHRVLATTWDNYNEISIYKGWHRNQSGWLLKGWCLLDARASALTMMDGLTSMAGVWHGPASFLNVFHTPGTIMPIRGGVHVWDKHWGIKGVNGGCREIWKVGLWENLRIKCLLAD